MRSGTPRRNVALLLTLAVAMGATLAVWRLSPWRLTTWLASQFRADWESAEDESLEKYARQLASLGDAGWRGLVAGLCSSRPEVRQAAQQGIKDLIASWQSQPPNVSAPKAARLAQLLAENLSQTDTDALGRFAELAARLLDWPPAAAGGLDRVFYCERILRAAKEQGWPQPDESELAPEPPALAGWISESSASPDVAPEKNPVAVTAIRPELRESTMRASEVAPPPQESRPLPVPSDGTLGLRDNSSDTIPAPSFPAAPPVEPTPPLEPASQVEPTPPVLVEEIPRPDWPRLELAEIIRHMRAGAPLLEALAELRRRGLDDRNVQVARAAADPNPDNRLQLVRALIELPGIDSTGWLLVLARDESPRVRTAAVQLLSTATDPRIRRRLDDLEQTETDPRVRMALQKAREASR
jgi:hypothetical protein